MPRAQIIYNGPEYSWRSLSRMCCNLAFELLMLLWPLKSVNVVCRGFYHLETLSEVLIFVHVLFANVYVIVVYKMIESCPKRRMIVAITLLGGQVN
jgi:hypothetical protein